MLVELTSGIYWKFGKETEDLVRYLAYLSRKGWRLTVAGRAL
jgi:hypothetical protein